MIDMYKFVKRGCRSVEVVLELGSN
jgi:hypothetical protein